MATYPVYADEAINGNLILGLNRLFQESANDLLTATGTTQATALQLTAELNRLGTVAASAGVLLPPSKAGLTIIIVNHGANAVQVYGSGTDIVDDTTTTTGVSQMINSTVLYTCHSPGNWYTEGLASGFVRGTGFQTVSSATVAGNTTVTQAAGTPITNALNVVTSAAAVAVTLPVSAPGMSITIINANANALTVFPNAGGTTTETINGGAANAGLATLASTSATYNCVTAGAWFTSPRVPS